MIRVLLAEDHAVFRVGLEELLDSEGDLEVVALVGDGASAVTAAAEHLPDVALLDISMPIMDGVEATRRIAEAEGDVRVVMLTASAKREQILRAIDAGALGYLLKDAPPEAIVDAIHAAARGEAPLAPRAARELLADRRESGAPELTAREREVLGLLAEGMPNKLIAKRLEISEKTVKAHLTRVYKRLGVSDRTQAALWAREHRIGADQADGPGKPGATG